MPEVIVRKVRGIRPVKVNISGKAPASGILWKNYDSVTTQVERDEVFNVALRPLPGFKRVLRLKYKGAYVESVDMLGCSVEVLNAVRVEEL